jgi:hypothetical protein
MVAAGPLRRPAPPRQLRCWLTMTQMADPTVDAINAAASGHVKRGIALMQPGDPARAIEALKCFDEALALRRQIPTSVAPFQGYLLAACLLNRADALVRLGGAERLSCALTDADEAVGILRELPLGEDDRFPRRLAMALHNGGLVRQVSARPEEIDLAATAFRDALAVLNHDQSTRIPDRDYLRGVVWMSLANLEAGREDPEADRRARDAVKMSLVHLANLETTDPGAAEAGVRARHVLCRCCASALSRPAPAGEPMPNEVHDATDAVDEGLALAREWERRGVIGLRPLAVDLFRFGVRVYARYQPHFVREFIEENVNPAQSSSAFVESAEMQQALQEALLLTR